MVAIQEAEARGVAADLARFRPPAIAIGQTELHEWARGRVWDCRQACCVVADFRAPISSSLDRDYLWQRLHSYPDQTLVANLMDGVRLDADVELMVKNAHAYNTPDSQVYHDASTLREIYLRGRAKHVAS